MKNLIALTFILLCFQLPGAVEKIDAPFKYFLSKMDISMDTAYFGLTPTIVLPDLILSYNEKGGSAFDGFNSVGIGIDYGRYVKSTNGKVCETFGASLFLTRSYHAGFVVHLFDRLMGIGGGINLNDVPRYKRYEIMAVTGFGLPQLFKMF